MDALSWLLVLSWAAWWFLGISLISKPSAARLVTFLLIYVVFMVSAVWYAMVASQPAFIAIPFFLIFSHYYSIKVVNNAVDND